MSKARLLVLPLLGLALSPTRAAAWPADLSQRIAKDALKLVPRSLAEVFLRNEVEIFADARTSQMAALPLVYLDLPKSRLSKETKIALGRELKERADALHGQDFRAAVIALGATYRLVVDLSDPGVGLGFGTDAKAKAIRREFYLFTVANLDKIPVVVVEPDSMRLGLENIPDFLGEVAAKTPPSAERLRAEGQADGRVLRAAEIDFRSPVFAVASTAYSRSVSAVAATWIAVWRSAGGDMKRQKPPQIISPRLPELNQEH